MMLLIAFACHGGGGDEMLASPKASFGFKGRGADILNVRIDNPDVNATHYARWYLGSGFVVENPAVQEGFHQEDPQQEVFYRARFAIPLGRMDPGSDGIETGVVMVEIVRKKNGQSASSPPQDFFISQFTGGFVEPPGGVALAAVNAMRDSVVRGIAGMQKLDEFAKGQLVFDNPLHAAVQDLIALDTLANLVERAMGGEVIFLGFHGSELIVLDTFSLSLMDRLVATMNGALANQLAPNSPPPDISSFGSFYLVIAHNFDEDAADAIRVVGGAARCGLSLYEIALQADGSSVAKLDGSTLGAIAWFNTFATGFTSVLMLDALPAHAGVSQGSFVIVMDASERMVPYVHDIAKSHFGSGNTFSTKYGDELSSAGEKSVAGLLSKKDIILGVQGGYVNTSVPTNGLPPPEFTVELNADKVGGEYNTNVSTDPATAGQTLVIFILGSDGFVSGQEVVTDSSGVAVAGPFNGTGNGFDIVTVVNPNTGGLESQDGTIITFP